MTGGVVGGGACDVRSRAQRTPKTDDRRAGRTRPVRQASVMLNSTQGKERDLSKKQKETNIRTRKTKLRWTLVKKKTSKSSLHLFTWALHNLLACIQLFNQHNLDCKYRFLDLQISCYLRLFDSWITTLKIFTASSHISYSIFVIGGLYEKETKLFQENFTLYCKLVWFKTMVIFSLNHVLNQKLLNIKQWFKRKETVFIQPCL